MEKEDEDTQESQNTEPVIAKKQKSIKLNLIMNITLTAVLAFFPLITFPYIARVLSPEGIGAVSFITAIIAYFTLFACLGIPVYGIRACAKVRDDKEKLSKTVQELLIINLIFAFFSYCVLGLCLLVIDKMQQELLLTLILSFSILLTSVSLSWFFQAIEEYVFITIRTIIVNIIALIALFIFVKTKNDYVIYALITILANCGTSLLNLLYSRKFISFKKKGKYNLKQHLKPIFVFFMLAGAISIYTNLDKLMLGFMLNDGNYNNGIYEACLKIYRLCTGIVTAFGVVLLPRIIYYYKNNDTEKINDLLKKAVNFVFILSIPIIVFLFVFAKDIIILLGGNEFINSVKPLRILLFGILLIGLNNITGFLMLTATNREKYFALSVVIGAFVNATLNAFLIPIYGAVAVAISVIVAELIILAVQCIILRKELIPLITSIRIIKLATLTLCLSVAIYACSFINLSLFLNIMFALFAGGIVYFGILLIFREQMLMFILNILFKKLLRRK